MMFKNSPCIGCKEQWSAGRNCSCADNCKKLDEWINEKRKNTCPKCKNPLILHNNSDLKYCSNCNYDEHYEEAKDEVLHIIKSIFKEYDQEYNEPFHIENGSRWTYDDVIKFLEENLR